MVVFKRPRAGWQLWRGGRPLSFAPPRQTVVITAHNTPRRCFRFGVLPGLVSFAYEADAYNARFVPIFFGRYINVPAVAEHVQVRSHQETRFCRLVAPNPYSRWIYNNARVRYFDAAQLGNIVFFFIYVTVQNVRCTVAHAR